MEDGVIDFHLHLPWHIRNPIEAANLLVKEMDKAGVVQGVVIAVETSYKVFAANVDKDKVVKSLLDHIYLFLPPIPHYLSRLFEDPEGALKEHIVLLKEHYRSSLDVVEASKAYPNRLYPVSSYNPDAGVLGNIESIKTLSDYIIGVKLMPTIHFVKPDRKPLYKLYKVLEELGLLLIVHTGCDPGIWEIPRFCEFARPKYLVDIARRFEDLIIVMSHMGSYSALKPGIFMNEAIEAYNKFDNIYVDTSAVDPFIVEIFVESVGDHKRILFGSDYPYVVGLTIRKGIEYIKETSIPQKILRAILRDNAANLLKAIKS